MKKQFEVEQRIHDDKIIEMRNLELSNDMKLKESAELKGRKAKISKKRRMKIEKIKADGSLNEHEKAALIGDLEGEE